MLMASEPLCKSMDVRMMAIKSSLREHISFNLWTLRTSSGPSCTLALLLLHSCNLLWDTSSCTVPNTMPLTLISTCESVAVTTHPIVLFCRRDVRCRWSPRTMTRSRETECTHLGPYYVYVYPPCPCSWQEFYTFYWVKINYYESGCGSAVEGGWNLNCTSHLRELLLLVLIQQQHKGITVWEGGTV